MVAAIEEFRTVESLMALRHIDLETLAKKTGVERRIVAAMAEQRFTPSPEQRRRVSEALRFPRERIVWGHRETVQLDVNPRL